jgi:hypothetical protein
MVPQFGGNYSGDKTSRWDESIGWDEGSHTMAVAYSL